MHVLVLPLGMVVATAGSGEDAHSALNPVLVPDPSVCMRTVMVGPVALLVKVPGLELSQNFSL